MISNLCKFKGCYTHNRKKYSKNVVNTLENYFVMRERERVREREKPTLNKIIEGSEILKIVLNSALDKMNRIKATGSDGVVIEMLSVFDETHEIIYVEKGNNR